MIVTFVLTFYPLIFEYRYNKILDNIKVFGGLFALSLGPRKDIILQVENDGIITIIKEWGFECFLYLEFILVFWFFCFLTRSIV